LGVIHGFYQLGGISQSARDVIRDIAGEFIQPGNKPG
jgi:acetyl esterase